MNTIPTIGQRVVVLSHYTHEYERDASVVGGGIVLDVEPYGSVTVAQPYKHSHNGVVVEEGTTPVRFQILTHVFEIKES